MMMMMPREVTRAERVPAELDKTKKKKLEEAREGSKSQTRSRRDRDGMGKLQSIDLSDVNLARRGLCVAQVTVDCSGVAVRGEYMYRTLLHAVQLVNKQGIIALFCDLYNLNCAFPSNLAKVPHKYPHAGRCC